MDIDILARICYALFTVFEKILNDEKHLNEKYRLYYRLRMLIPK